MAPLDPAVEGFPIPFLPQDRELLDCLLRPKIDGDHIDARFTEFVHFVDDVYALPPDQLVETHQGATGAGGDKVWFFFSPLVGEGSGGRPRTVGGDGSKRWCWVGSKKKVEGRAAGGGYSQKLMYKEKTASGVVAPGWTMVEYSVALEHGGANLVLCKIFHSPHAARSESGSPSSNTSAYASPSCSGGRKRKIAE